MSNSWRRHMDFQGPLMYENILPWGRGKVNLQCLKRARGRRDWRVERAWMQGRINESGRGKGEGIHVLNRVGDIFQGAGARWNAKVESASRPRNERRRCFLGFWWGQILGAVVWFAEEYGRWKSQSLQPVTRGNGQLSFWAFWGERSANWRAIGLGLGMLASVRIGTRGTLWSCPNPLETLKFNQ